MHIHLSTKEQWEKVVASVEGASLVVYAAQDGLQRPVLDEKGDLKKMRIGTSIGVVEEIQTEPHNPVHAVGFLWPSGATLHVAHPQVVVEELLKVFPQALRVDSIHP
jgi:hypothetical protein